ncbi:threonine--tRNA ligase [Patescibacteria group bacterium]|nr:threonine--tRNA ligase [Patescibacteria group bacterium]MBU1499964.1 threonine--tRNA ligase [Patescibacteria group bacterium]
MPKDLHPLRHTCEHVLHTAMQNLYPKLKKAMGPATDEGFYFDFDLQDKISEADFPKIEAEMQRLIDQDLPMKQKFVTEAEAIKIFKNNPYKLDWLDGIVKRGEKISLYEMGDNVDLDLCSGPHVKSTGEIKAFKLLSVAGAYWHGDETKKMLTRIYGTAFYSQKELDEYLKLLEEAKKRDHRKLGAQLEIFSISEEVGQGLILWLPKGQIIKDELENWAKQTEDKWGYQRVTTPNIGKTGLYKTSGHLPYYKNDMYPVMKGEKGEEYILKPMNCPHHHQIYKSKPRSYKELPLRLAEFGTCYRYEASGELFGLMRVRGFTQNDSHIYCAEDQAVEEFVSVMKLHQYYYRHLGITNYHLELALRDPKNKHKYSGNDAMWEKAEKLMRLAAAKVKIPMVISIGNAAFYGPKIDFIIASSIGREFAISTNQIDLFMGERFQLKYTDSDGQDKIPVIIHRAPLGSHERFIAFLIEHFAGNFPTWLTPVQVKILPISDKQNKYAQTIADQLKLNHIRVELDDRAEALGAKIRDAQLEKVSYMLILGNQEQKSKTLSIRNRAGKQTKLDIDKFIATIKQEIYAKIL